MVLEYVHSVGIALGSLMCNRLLKGQVHATFVPLGALGIAVFSLDLYFVLADVSGVGTGTELVGATAFLANSANWRGIIDLFLVAVSGGIYMVPLNAMLQQRSEPSFRRETSVPRWRPSTSPR